MKFGVFLGLGALVGLGIYAKNKFSEHKEECGMVYTGEKETISDKIHNASIFAVGTVRTSVDKISEGLKETKTSDIMKKGEETVEVIKNSAESIKKDILDLKDMIVSKKNSDYDYVESEDIFDEMEQVEDLNGEFGVMETPDGTANTRDGFDDLEEI